MQSSESRTGVLGPMELTGASLAPKNLNTFAKLQGRRPQERVREIPEVLASRPRPVDLDSHMFTKCLVGAPAGLKLPCC